MGWPVSASHSRTVLSSLPEAMRLPSGLNATLVTASVWPVSGCADRLAGVRVPQPHRLVGAAGDDPLAVGAERHTGHRVRCGRSAAAPIGWPVSASHSRTVLSSAAGDDPLAVGAERHARTPCRCGRSAAGRRVGRCRRPTAAPSLSSLPETMRLPSGLNATLCTTSGVAGQRLADRLAGVGVPQPHRLVVTAGDDARAVGAERHAGHRVGVAGQRLADRVGRWPRPTPAPSCRRCRRRCACRRG